MTFFSVEWSLDFRSLITDFRSTQSAPEFKYRRLDASVEGGRTLGLDRLLNKLWRKHVLLTFSMLIHLGIANTELTSE